MHRKFPSERTTFSTVLRALVIVGVLSPLALHAAPATLASDAELRVDRYVDAATVISVKKGTPVETLKTDAGWVQVRVGQSVGWLRASLLSGAGATVASVAQVEGGRSAPGNIMATSGIRTLNRPSPHALIIGVSEYADPAISMLKGGKYEIESATRLAESMSIPKENIQTIRDLDATSERIESEFGNLEKRMRPGDRVFLYFWGLGSRWYGAAVKLGGCAEALLPAGDAVPPAGRQMAELLQPISDKADKLLVFYCPRM